MSLKSWVLDRVHRMNGLYARADLPPRDAASEAPPARAAKGPITQAPPDSLLSNAEHLGAYGPLIAAIREELEHFVASQVRLHLAIADHDRFLLTSVGVDCPDAPEARQLLQQFMREFKPEQVRRYLAREVIGALPNAAAMDLSQFAGLFDAQARADDGAAEEYAELLAALRSAAPSAVARPYQVSIVGRWSETDAMSPLAAAGARAQNGATFSTPMAGQRCEFDLDDGDGRRRVVLQSVVPGRRYSVGKGEGCDIRVNGTYTSRRHAEIWLDKGQWWVADAGSTNGIRVESPAGRVERCGSAAGTAASPQPLQIAEGERIVLSAQAEGPPSDYPWVMRSPAHAASRVTPIAAGTVSAAPKTPLTAILVAPAADKVLTLTAHLAAGVCTMELRDGVLPVTVGRSRNQQLVVDRVHGGVSGHHLDITEIDEAGAQVVVHGDNGVVVEGIVHAAGTRFRWKVGETMVLGAALQDDPECTLVLS